MGAVTRSHSILLGGAPFLPNPTRPALAHWFLHFNFRQPSSWADSCVESHPASAQVRQASLVSCLNPTRAAGRCSRRLRVPVEGYHSPGCHANGLVHGIQMYELSKQCCSECCMTRWFDIPPTRPAMPTRPEFMLEVGIELRRSTLRLDCSRQRWRRACVGSTIGPKIFFSQAFRT